MDPSVAHAQVQCVRRAIAANVELAAEKAIHLQDVFIHPSFSLDLTSVLEDAVGDSVVLHALYGGIHKFLATDVDFLTKQARRMHTAGDDITQLRRTDVNRAKLATTSDAFVLDVVEDIAAVLNDNAFVASEHHIAPDTLSMCKPSFSSLFCQTLSRVVRSHVTLWAETETLRAARAALEDKLATVTQEKEKLAAAVAAVQKTVVELEQAVHELQEEINRGKADEEAQARVIELEQVVRELQEEVERGKADATAQARVVALEESLSALQEENVRLRMDAKNAEVVAQGLARKLEAELCRVHTAHLSCDMKLQERDDEIAHLREECKKTIGMHQEQLTGAAEVARQLALKSEEKLRVELERNKLATELTAMKESYKSFSIFKSQERARMTAEVVRLRKSLNAGSTVSDDGLVEENMQLKTSVQTLQGELSEANSKVSVALDNCRMWKFTLDGVVARNASGMERIRNAAAAEQEIDEGQLLNAKRKIADLEAQLRERVADISALRKAQIGERNHEGLNLAFDGALALPNRIQEMAVMPQVAAPAPAPALAVTTRIFTKKSLVSILGGYIANILGRCTTNATEFSRTHSIREYLCLNTEYHACLPADPGKHGYMQFGFGKDSGLFEKGEYRHIFVGTGKFYIYYGFYHVLRVESLTQDEWASLPIQMKMVYSDLAMQKDKSDNPTTMQQVFADHESGALRAPCIRLQCVAFDVKFHEKLIRANKEVLGQPAKRSNGSNGGRKRQRVAPVRGSGCDDSGEDNLSLRASARERNTTNPRRRKRHVSSSPLSSLSGEE